MHLKLTTASTGHCYCHKTCFSLRSASFAPMYAMPVKQMLDWRCARGKRRKYSSKNRIVCQEEKRLFVKKQYERIGLSNGEEFLREEEF